MDQALEAPSVAASAGPTSAGVPVIEILDSFEGAERVHLPTPTPISVISDDDKASDAFKADLAEVSGLPVSSLFFTRSSKRPSPEPSSSLSKKSRSDLSSTPLTQTSPETALPPPPPPRSNVPLNINLRVNPYHRVSRSLPSSSSSLTDPVNEALLKTLRDSGLECPPASSSSPLQVSFPGRLTTIDGIQSAKLLASIARAEDWVDLQSLSSVELEQMAALHEVKVINLFTFITIYLYIYFVYVISRVLLFTCF